MNSKKITLFFLLSVIFFSAKAQQAQIKFDHTEFQFGDVEELKGDIEHKFSFTNTGTSPLVIQSVKASCGCTTPAWTKEPIGPGKTGFIQARYNPKNRPGAFHKSLTVTTNSDPAVTRLYIKGKVIPKPRSVEEDFPVLNGSLRFKYRTFNLGNIGDHDIAKKSFDVVNTSNRSINFTKASKLPNFIKVSFIPNSLKPGQKGKMIINYYAEERNDLGFVSDYIEIATNDVSTPNKKVRVVVNIEQDFSKLSQTEKANAARLSFVTKYHDFGEIKANSKVKTSFKYKNNGKENLIIKKVKASCGCTIPKILTKSIKPGKEGEIELTFDATGREGSQVKSITIYSNDPINPVQVLTVKARI